VVSLAQQGFGPSGLELTTIAPNGAPIRLRPCRAGSANAIIGERNHRKTINDSSINLLQRSYAMASGGNNQSRSVTRRDFLKTSSTIAGAAGLAPTLSAPFVSTALADTKTLKIVQWSHFIPQYDTWIDGFAKDWGKQNGVTVTVDHIPHLELPARAAAEVAAGAGHDIFGFNGSGGPHLYAKYTHDMTSLVQSVEAKHGKVLPMGRQTAWNEPTQTWIAFPDYFIDFPGLYRKDLWDEIGMKPDTWEDIRIGGAKLKQKGNPLGIALSHCVDPNNSYRSMLWSHGAAVCDETGKRVVLDSKETLEVVKFVKALYAEAMESVVLSWDDAGNNRYLASGRASWIHNPISAYRTIQKSNPELADKIFVWKTPAGTVRRMAAGAPNSYIIWKFARNKDTAIEFLKYYADHYGEAFNASTGYDHPLFANLVPTPTILSNDPTSHPSDKLKILETAGEWCSVFGYPGPSTPAADEVADNFIIPDMMANAALDKMTPEEAVKWASKEIGLIYAKWATRT
jgi:multiple sugar transport system substrate-binding protein